MSQSPQRVYQDCDHDIEPLLLLIDAGVRFRTPVCVPSTPERQRHVSLRPPLPHGDHEPSVRR